MSFSKTRPLSSLSQSGGPRINGERSSLSQDVASLAAPDHQRDHSKREEDRDEDEDSQEVVWRVHPHHPLHGAVGEEVLVDVDDEALHQLVGPEAADALRVMFRAEREQVVLTVDRGWKKERRRDREKDCV